MPDVAEIAGRLSEAQRELRENAICLESWFNSLSTNQREVTFYGVYGVERAAKDALDAAFRLAASTVDALKQTADAMDAVRAYLENSREQ